MPLIADRLRLATEIWLHRHGPWSVALVAIFGSLLALASILFPGLQSELAKKQAALGELQARVADDPAPPAPPQSPSERHYHAFRQILAEENQVLPSIQAVLDSAASHQLVSTRAEYVRHHDPLAQAGTLQMSIPVKGRYTDIRRWIEEILATHAFVAIDELRFKRDDIGLSQIEAKVRLTIWHHPARPSDRVRGIDPGEVDP